MNALPFEMMEDFAAFETVAIGIMIAILVFYLIAMAFAIVAYVLRSLGIYTIAKRRGIHHPWLAWIPVGDLWTMGSISDQYQYVSKGKVRNRRKVLLGLSIALYALMVVLIVVEVATMFMLESNTGAAVASGISLIPITLAYIGLGITTTVFMYIAMYDIYNSCNPDNAVMFLVLGIFFNVLQPFFLFACRKKDLGMPPRRKPEAQPVIAEIPQQAPVAEPAACDICQEEVSAPILAQEPAQFAEDACVAEEDDFVEETNENE